MATYLTEYKQGGKRWAGPKIEAGSWEDAEKVLPSAPRGLRVVGRLVVEFDVADDTTLEDCEFWLSQARHFDRTVA